MIQISTHPSSLVVTDKKWRGTGAQRALDLDVVPWRLAVPVDVRQVAFLDEQVGKHAGIIVVDDVGCFRFGEARHIRVFGVGSGIVADFAPPIVAAEGGEARTKVGKELEDLHAAKSVVYVNANPVRLDDLSLTKSSPAAPILKYRS